MSYNLLLILEIALSGFTALAALARPVQFGTVLGYDASSSSAMNEVRAQYGGFFGAVGIVLMLALVGRLPLETGFIIGAMVFGGLAFGRIFSIIATRKYFCMVPTVRGLTFIDPIVFALNLAALGVFGGHAA